MDGCKILRSSLQVGKQSFGIYLPGASIRTMGKDICIDDVPSHTAHEKQHHPFPSGSYTECFCRLEYGNYNYHYRDMRYGLCGTWGYPGSCMDRCNPGNHPYTWCGCY